MDLWKKRAQVDGPETYNDAFWQDGQAGDANVVTFNGEDVRPVMRIDNDKLRYQVIARHNETIRRLRAGREVQPFEAHE